MPPEVFDLDAVAREVRREPFVFRYAGRSWRLPHLQDLDWSVLGAADQGDAAAIREALRLGLGKRWAEFARLELSLGALNRLFVAWQEHAGLAPGESDASAGSSPSTGRRSTPTSRRTTG